MPEFVYRATLIDTKGLRTTMSFNMADPAYADAILGAAALETALEAVTDANILASSLTEKITGDGTKPADADVTDQALVVCYLSGAGEPEKFWNVRIPAPIDGMFNADLLTVDITNQPLQDFVATISSECLVSDGEPINLALQEGIHSGSWRSVKKNP
jgi:hypothetical protein